MLSYKVLDPIMVHMTSQKVEGKDKCCRYSLALFWALVLAGEMRLWYTMFAHASSSLGNLHTYFYTETKASWTAKWPHCRVRLWLRIAPQKCTNSTCKLVWRKQVTLLLENTLSWLTDMFLWRHWQKMKPCIVCMYHGCEEMIRKVRETLANTEALEDSTCNHYRAPRRVQTLIERNLPGHKQKPLPFTYIQPLPSTTATLSCTCACAQVYACQVWNEKGTNTCFV